VLRKMGCPATLQANQIQGGDYNAVFPVVQWVVTKVLETRRATGDMSRKASEAHFVRRLGDDLERATALAADTRELRSLGASTSEFARDVSARYAPKRRFRRSNALWSSGASMNAVARIQACLLEYGEKVAPGSALSAAEGDEEGSAGTSEFDRKVRAMRKAAREAEEKRAREAAELEAAMLGEMSSTAGHKVSGRDVQRLVGLGEGGIARSKEALLAAQEALLREAESGELLANSRVGKAQAHRRRVAKLGKAAEKAELRRAVAEEECLAAKAELERVQTEVDVTGGLLRDVERAMAEVAERARAGGHEEGWMAVRRLLATLNLLVMQEKEFKRTCRRQLADLEARLAALRAEVEAEGTDSGGRLSLAAAAHAEASERHRKIRMMLARRNREISRVQRLLDDVPSRSELLQYEKRFTDLFEEINSTRGEIAKQFAAYNFQNEERKLLDQELKLISSIQSSFKVAMASSAGQQQFLDQSGSFLTSTKELAARHTKKLMERRTERDELVVECDSMADKQRAYFRAVKQLQAQAELNERLATRLENAGLPFPAVE
jgi:arsenate reductase-like glutaredoxin family protein